ncbi:MULTISPECIES: hypothetical protein [unclassified Deinococcus]|uniref:hypothetical protein n=1 Tax=unclassified Deinococcus TaxID=2623546 RepID=UPI00118054A6|nr:MULTISPECIES: hypothetical protein [unclassified Deinococcus]MBX8464918.1 hypothetical protein [Deinococcus sp. RIT780]
MDWAFLTAAYRCPHQLLSCDVSYSQVQEQPELSPAPRQTQLSWYRNHSFHLSISPENDPQGVAAVVDIKDGVYTAQKGQEFTRLEVAELERRQGLIGMHIPPAYLQPTLSNFRFQNQVICRTKELITQCYLISVENCVFLERQAFEVQAQPVPPLLRGSTSDDLLENSLSCQYIIDRDSGLTLFRRVESTGRRVDVMIVNAFKCTFI